jgi:protein subunit release factor B
MNAILLITSGTGPDEVRQFVALLARKMTRICADLGLDVRVCGPRVTETAPRSITLSLRGDCLDRIALEEGTHALIARSPERSQRSRKRWFASVKLLADPQAPSLFQPDKLVITACRAGGPGGQNVNKRSTAVRVRDPNSGIAVRVDEQRMQSSNRRLAEERIRAALQERNSAQASLRDKGLRALHYRVERGNPVRTWHIDAQGQLQEVM